MDNKSIIIQKFDGTNFYMWRFKIELLLQRDKLWSTVNQEPPTPITDDWTSRDQAAKATICLAMEDKFLINVRSCTTAKNTWETLKKIYEHPSLSCKINLMRRLYGNRYDDHPNMRDFINSTLELVGQLMNLGEETKEKNIIAILLGGLPADYNNLITAIESKEENELTLEFVKIKLFEEATRREKIKQGTPMESLAMQAMRHNIYPPRQFICFGCGQQGHQRRDCPKEKARSENPRWRNYTAQETPRTSYRPNNDLSTLMSTQIFDEPELITALDDTHIETIPHSIYDQNEHYQPGNYTALSGTVFPHPEPQGWILDSGASAHMTPNKNFFQSLTYLKTKLPVKLANGEVVYAEGRGHGLVILNNDIKSDDQVQIKDVLYVPGLHFQLISIKQLCDRGHDVYFSKAECRIVNNNQTIASAQIKDGVFRLQETHSHSASPCIHNWHERLGHRSLETIKHMQSDKAISPINITSCNHSNNCRVCNIGKMKQRTFNPSSESITKPFQVIVSDVCGPLQVPSLGGNYYFLTITDKFSRYIHIDILKNKSQVTEKLQQFIELGRNKFKYYPNVVRSDGGGEFVNHELDTYLKNHGISHQVVAPYAPQQNGCAERVNSTLMAMCRCMLKQFNLPNKLWGEAVTMAAYIINRTSHASTNKTPYEMWNGELPNISNLKTFGCIGYAFKPRVLRRKLDETSIEGVFVGYCRNTKGFRLWIPESNTVITTTKMVFDERPYDYHHPSMFASQKKYSDNYFVSQPGNHISDDNTIEVSPRRSNRENKGKPPIKLTY